jgi:hypothetical protein
MTSLPTSIQSFLLRELRTLRRELSLYPDTQSIWALPPGISNSAGTLALHLAGNLQHFIGAKLGKSDYRRDRDAEFALRDLPLEQILQQIDAAEASIRSTLPNLSETDLAGEFPQAFHGTRLDTDEMLIGLAVHLGYHLGQINYHRRIVTGNTEASGALSMDELSSARPHDAAR